MKERVNQTLVIASKQSERGNLNSMRYIYKKFPRA